MGMQRHEFKALYRTHAGELLGYLRRRGAGDAAPDLLAETFLTAWRRRSDLPDAVNRRAWLFGTVRRLLLAHRRTSQQVTPVDDLDDLPSRRPDAPADSMREDLVRQALTRLPEVDRELLTLTVWERLPIVEAAVVVGLSANAARVRLHRARKRLADDPTLRDAIQSTPAP